jgi:hypothetical protein
MTFSAATREREGHGPFSLSHPLWRKAQFHATNEVFGTHRHPGCPTQPVRPQPVNATASANAFDGVIKLTQFSGHNRLSCPVGSDHAADPRNGALKANTPPSEAVSQYPPVALSLRTATMGRFNRMLPVEPKNGWLKQKTPPSEATNR